jgi:putative ABC transport system permease protein
MWFDEARQSVRGLVRSPLFSVTFVITLALGVGVNSAMFSVLYGVLLRPLQNSHADRIIYIRQIAESLGSLNVRFSVPEIDDFRKHARAIETFGTFSILSFTLNGLGDPRQVRAGVVDGDYFGVMGLRPVLGRLLGPNDDGPTAAGAVVLSHRFWIALGADPGVVGQSVRLGAREATVVGVLEPAPPYPDDTEVIANVVTSPHHLSATMVTDRQHRMTDLFGRLAPGSTVESARSEIRLMHRRMSAAFPADYPADQSLSVTAVPLLEQMTAHARPSLLLLFGMAACVLLLACANVGGLLMTRLAQRARELSLRVALGASRVRLRASLLLECLVLSLAGAALSIVFALPVARMVASFSERYTVRALDAPLIEAALVFGVIVALVAAAAVALLVPIGTTHHYQLPQQGSRFGPSRAARRVQHSLVGVQIAISFVVLTGAGLFGSSVIALRDVNTGYNGDHVLALDVPLIPRGGGSSSQTFYRELERQVAALPGVTSVAVGSMVPLAEDGGYFNSLEFAAEGAIRPDGMTHRAHFRSVSPSYLATLGVPLLSGRAFNEGDRVDAEDVVIVSKTLVERVFDGRDPVGRYLRWTDPKMKFGGIETTPRRIVGVVGDVRELALERAPEMLIYHPFDQEPLGGRLFVRTSGDPHRLEQAIVKTARALAGHQPVAVRGTLGDIRARVIEPTLVTTLLIGALGIVAAAIAMVGIFGVFAYSVSRRTREFGTRLALGAEPRDITVRVISEALIVCGAGIAIGVGGAFWFGRAMSSMLFGVRPSDPLVHALTAVLLLSVGAAASAIPAIRASRVDPAVSLRTEG